MKKHFTFIAILSLILASLTSASFAIGQTETPIEDQYMLQLQGLAWNKATIDALVITPTNESWWNPLYLNATIRAIGQWNEAFSSFALNYTEFSYLKNIKITTKISNQIQQGYDLYINWTEAPLRSTSDEIGLSRTLSLRSQVITNSSIMLAAATNHGTPLSDGDMQNIALHELGHSIGLGHSNHTSDLMYPMYSLRSSAESISTLNMYGVATVFAWLINPSSFYPVNEWLTRNYVILPANITYEHLTVSAQNARPPSITDNPVVQFFIFIYELLIHPEIGVVVIFVIILFVIVALIPRKKKVQDEIKVDS
jgi:predicted Zn-dependent protease